MIRDSQVSLESPCMMNMLVNVSYSCKFHGVLVYHMSNKIYIYRIVAKNWCNIISFLER
jgi:hypothetical protein